MANNRSIALSEASKRIEESGRATVEFLAGDKSKEGRYRLVGAEDAYRDALTIIKELRGAETSPPTVSGTTWRVTWRNGDLPTDVVADGLAKEEVTGDFLLCDESGCSVFVAPREAVQSISLASAR